VAAEEDPVLDLDRVQLARPDADERERLVLVERLLLDRGRTARRSGWRARRRTRGGNKKRFQECGPTA
jgi:hypothetical protein